MRWLFITDTLSALNPKKDSTIALMRCAARRDEVVYSASLNNLSINGGRVIVDSSLLSLSDDDSQWLLAQQPEQHDSDDFDLVLMRKEPPVDDNFITATQLLDIVNQRTPVFNAPRALREMNEKLSIFQFPQWILPTWVGANVDQAVAFQQRYGRVVLKPLNGMGGDGIYVTPTTDLNFRSIFDLLSHHGSRSVMAQQYSADARTGDCRLFIVAGKPLPWMLVRLPRIDDYRNNMAAGGRGEARPIDDHSRRLAESVGAALCDAGVLFAGLDVIGGQLIEINITCPTGLREVYDQTGDNIADAVLTAFSSAGQLALKRSTKTIT